MIKNLAIEIVKDLPSSAIGVKYFHMSLIHVLEANLDDESFQVSDKNILNKTVHFHRKGAYFLNRGGWTSTSDIVRQIIRLNKYQPKCTTPFGGSKKSHA